MLKPRRSDQETSEEELFIKARQIPQQKQYLSRFKNEAQQKMNLSRSTKSEFPYLIFGPC